MSELSALFVVVVCCCSDDFSATKNCIDLIFFFKVPYQCLVDPGPDFQFRTQNPLEKINCKKNRKKKIAKHEITTEMIFFQF